ncbi:MAG: LPS export ABC transporter permease LptG [Proteobacteria bacterium]|nr:LPS export ABC transporter permease LptG [Pseudomonadota bacterium]
MKLIQRYVGKTIFSMIGLVVLLLLGVAIFILCISQISDIGRGDYGVLAALLYVLYHIPSELYQFFPVACLLGTLLGLGTLASHSELIVLRSSGVSIWQVTIALLKTAFLLIILVTIAAEIIIPPALNTAENRKADEISFGQTLRTPKGIWVHDKNNYIHIKSIFENGDMIGISRYEFGSNQQLEKASYASQGRYENDRWVMNNVAVSIIQNERVLAEHYDKQQWDISLKPKLLAIARIEPTEMPLNKLYRYTRQHYASISQSNYYELIFWQRIFQPVASLVMILLAIPFIFGPLRSATLGLRLIAGISVGFGFYLMNQLFGPLSLVYQLNPFIAAILPSVLVFIAAVWMLRRI